MDKNEQKVVNDEVHARISSIKVQKRFGEIKFEKNETENENIKTKRRKWNPSMAT